MTKNNKLTQDYENWKQARDAVKQEKSRLESIRESITANCDTAVFSDNLAKMHMFVQEVRGAGNNPDVVNRGAKRYRAISCFYRWVYDIEGNDGKSGYVEVLGPVPCINVDQKGCSYNEEQCEGCKHFAGLVEYQAQKAQLELAIEKRKAAKRKVFSNFMR